MSSGLADNSDRQSVSAKGTWANADVEGQQGIDHRTHAVKLVRDNSADTDSEQKTFTYGYDVNGNLATIDDTSSGAGVDAYKVAYDDLNQVSSVTENLADTPKTTTSYGYDANGQPAKVTVISRNTYDGFDHRPITPGSRWLQTAATPSSAMSRNRGRLLQVPGRRRSR